MANKKIKCDVTSCKHCDCDKKCCELDKIKICNCTDYDAMDADCTMCDSFECK